MTTSTPKPLGEFRTVVIAVEDMEQACRFYAQTLGLGLKFRDGDRWAAFDAGVFTLALAGQDQKPVDSRTALNLKVADVATALEAAVAGGAELIRTASVGAHEVSGAFRDPTGMLIYVYSPLKP